MKYKLLTRILKRIYPTIAMIAAVTMLGGPVSYAADNTITAELGDTYTIGAGYYDEDTTINVPTLASQTPGTATAADILLGKTAFVNGEEVEGIIPNAVIVAGAQSDGTFKYSIAGASYTGSGSNGSIAKLTPSYSSGSSQSAVKAGGTVTLPAGTYNKDEMVITADSLANQTIGTATAANILSGKTAWVGGNKITGTIPSKAAQTYTPTTTDQTIASKQYLSGVQTIKGDANLVAENIAQGKSIFGVDGSYTSDATATAAQILKDKTAYVNGEKITGTIESKAAATYNVSTSNRTIAANQYLSGAQTIRAVTTANISAGNIKSGVTVKVGDSADDDRIKGVAGTFTSASTVSSGQTAADAAQILTGYSAWVDGAEVKGSIPIKAAATYNTSTSNQTIAANQYLSGAQTIRAVTTANISAGNIKSGVTVKVGDSADDDRIKGVAGTFTSASTVSSGQTAAAAAQILSGYSAWVDGAEVKGSIASKAAATYNTSTSNQTIAANQYLSGAQTIRAVTTANISAGNIKSGVTVKVGDSADDDRIKGVAGTFTSASTVSSGQTAAAAAQILSGYSAWVDGAEVKGSITSKAAATYNTSTSDQTIAASQYLDGVQTIKAVKTSGISAANIKTGQVVKVGDANSTTRIANVTGTFTGDGTQTSGQTIAAAAQIRKGYSAWAKGAEVKGSIEDLAATTYNTSTSDQTIATGKYIAGTQTIKAVTTSGISAANIKSGQVVKVGDANSATRIANVTGTFTKANTVSSGQTAAAAAQIRSGYSAWVDGAEVKGSIANMAASDVTVSGKTVTVASGKYTNAAITHALTATEINGALTTLNSNTALTAEQAHVLSGKTYFGKDGAIKSGTMSDKSGAVASGTVGSYTKDSVNYLKMPISSAGYYDTSDYLYSTSVKYNPTKTIATGATTGTATSASTSSTATDIKLAQGYKATIPAGYYSSAITVHNNVTAPTTATGNVYSGDGGFLSGDASLTASTNLTLSDYVSGSQYAFTLGSDEQITFPAGYYSKPINVATKGGTAEIPWADHVIEVTQHTHVNACKRTSTCGGSEYTIEKDFWDDEGGRWIHATCSKCSVCGAEGAAGSTGGGTCGKRTVTYICGYYDKEVTKIYDKTVKRVLYQK